MLSMQAMTHPLFRRAAFGVCALSAPAFLSPCCTSKVLGDLELAHTQAQVPAREPVTLADANDVRAETAAALSR
jgi:hypothetical protein